jgi:hypothetical protein
LSSLASFVFPPIWESGKGTLVRELPAVGQTLWKSHALGFGGELPLDCPLEINAVYVPVFIVCGFHFSKSPYA